MANAGMTKMQQSLASGVTTASRYEDASLQAQALSLVPIDLLRERALASPSPLPGRDEELKQLLSWFKHSFFTWMNNPPCQACGEKNTKNAGTGPPTAEERQGDAGIVEVYRCPKCSATTRFPRYNNPATLLQTRSGRCGEWANAFTLFCRALDFDARWIHDWTDHVWTEVWSESRKRWLHCDSCENAIDKPLIYEVGWKKKLSYVIAFSRDEIADVTRRYSRAWPEVLSRRNDCPEGWLEMTIAQINFSLQSPVPTARKQLLEQRAKTEQQSLAEGGARELTAEEQVGRESGSAEWRQQRGEIGTQPSGCTSSAGSSWVPKVWQVAEGVAHWRLMYSVVRDAYFVESGDASGSNKTGWLPAAATSSAPSCRGWQTGMAAQANIKRTEEEDWNMVYLARASDGQKSHVQWTILLGDGGGGACKRKLRTASLLPRHSLHHDDARIQWSVSTDGSTWSSLEVAASVEQPVQLHEKLAESTQLHVRAELQGGNWQHTQLFRQSREELYRCELDLALSFEFVVVGSPQEKTVDEAVQLILSNPVEVQTAAMSLIRTLAANIAKAPEEAKFRSVRLTNSKIALGLVRPRGALQALMACGWQLDNGVLTLVAADDLQRMQNLVSSLPSEAVPPALKEVKSAAASAPAAAAATSSSAGYPCTAPAAKQVGDRMKELFAQFKAEGMEPNAAAAKAVQISKSEAQSKS